MGKGDGDEKIRVSADLLPNPNWKELNSNEAGQGQSREREKN